jgi:hypothetical protein
LSTAPASIELVIDKMPFKVTGKVKGSVLEN